MAKQTGLSGWGRTFVPGREVRSENLPAVTRNAVLTRGLGRSYGDASLPPANKTELAGSTLADRVLGFDTETGVLRAEAGLVLSDMNRLFLPRGFFTPVTPGTRFVTLGGMVASDVHGKNHHVDGTIGRHVQRLLVQTANGRTLECSREHERELFLATLGGMGLTGHILEVQLKLQAVPSPWIYRESFRIDNLDELLVKLKEAGKQWPFTVAWIDTIASGKNLGRGILYVGRWAEKSEAPDQLPKPQQQLLTMPFALPSGLLNRFTIGMFNRLVYYAHNKPHKQDICDPDTFFYPLDKVRHWNRAYGAAGVTQHQAVIPDEAGPAGVRRLIELLAETGSSSFLSVIKDCGPEGEGLISFPRPGMSLALDIPITGRTQEVIDRLNRHVLDCGGRIYLTKDGFTRGEDFRAMEPRLDGFLAVKAKWDPEQQIHSALSDRLFGAPTATLADDDEEQVERASRAFARAELEREERAREQRAAEQLANATASTAAIGQRPPLEVSAVAAGVVPVAPPGAVDTKRTILGAPALMGSLVRPAEAAAEESPPDSPPPQADVPLPAPEIAEAAPPAIAAQVLPEPPAPAEPPARSEPAPEHEAAASAAPEPPADAPPPPTDAAVEATASAPAAPESEPAVAIQSAPPVAVGTPPPTEPEPARSESSAPVFKPERTLVGPGPASSLPPAAEPLAAEPFVAEPPVAEPPVAEAAPAEAPPPEADAGDDVELESADDLKPVAEPVKSSVPPPVPAAATSRLPPPPSRAHVPSLPPVPGRLSVPPPPARLSSAPAARRMSVPAPPPSSAPVAAAPVAAASTVEVEAPAASAPIEPPRPASERPAFAPKSTLVGIPALVVPGHAPKPEQPREDKPDSTEDSKA